MKLRRTTRCNVWLMNLVPMVDVVFLLLIFFLLSMSLVLQPGVQVQVPFSPFLLGPLSNPTIISITAPPHPRIYLDAREVGVGEIASILKEKGDGASRMMLIKADINTSYELVARVASACIEAGHQVVLATTPEKSVEAMPLGEAQADEEGNTQ